MYGELKNYPTVIISLAVINGTGPIAEKGSSVIHKSKYLEMSPSTVVLIIMFSRLNTAVAGQDEWSVMDTAQ
jgi:hypothetical protein